MDLAAIHRRTITSSRVTGLPSRNGTGIRTWRAIRRAAYLHQIIAGVAALSLAGCNGIDPGMAQILILVGGLLVIPFVWRALKGSMEERREEEERASGYSGMPAGTGDGGTHDSHNARRDDAGIDDGGTDFTGDGGMDGSSDGGDSGAGD